jgi:hypothetical protein
MQRNLQTKEQTWKQRKQTEGMHDRTVCEDYVAYIDPVQESVLLGVCRPSNSFCRWSEKEASSCAGHPTHLLWFLERCENACARNVYMCVWLSASVTLRHIQLPALCLLLRQATGCNTNCVPWDFQPNAWHSMGNEYATEKLFAPTDLNTKTSRPDMTRYNLKVGCLHPVACTRSGSGFPSNATRVWIFYSVTVACFGLVTISRRKNIGASRDPKDGNPEHDEI